MNLKRFFDSERDSKIFMLYFNECYFFYTSEESVDWNDVTAMFKENWN